MHLFAVAITALLLSNAAHKPATLKSGIHASHAREAYATSWHYLPGQAHELRMDHLRNVWDRNGMRRYARSHGGR